MAEAKTKGLSEGKRAKLAKKRSKLEKKLAEVDALLNPPAPPAPDEATEPKKLKKAKAVNKAAGKKTDGGAKPKKAKSKTKR